MREPIVEFNIKGYSVKIDKDSIVVNTDNEILLKIDYQQLKTIIRLAITKVNELKNRIETKE
ncbi:MAG: hypothetical protein PHT84_04815 [Candidatus Pacebacteria bacterium]|nr:hypothetical protein [Candidatus Paceibacterota bacterium]